MLFTGAPIALLLHFYSLISTHTKGFGFNMLAAPRAFIDGYCPRDTNSYHSQQIL